MLDQTSLPPPQGYPHGFSLVSGEPDPVGFSRGSHLLLVIRTTFAGITTPSTFSAMLATGGMVMVPKFTLGPSALGSFALIRPQADADIADRVARGLAVIVSETPLGDDVHTSVTLSARGFTAEQVLTAERWQLPLEPWAVSGGTVERRIVGVLGFK